MEMKASGAYVARGLSWTDATFETVVAPLSESLQHAYDEAAGFLKTLRRAVAKAGLTSLVASPEELGETVMNAALRVTASERG